MTIVKVATLKPVKIEAIKAAFERFLSEEVQIIGYKVDSGVPEQPINQEVVCGAENRISALKEICGEYDYLVSCEGGIINLYGYNINAQIVLMENKEGIRSMGMSQGFEVPECYMEEIKRSSIARCFDRIFGKNKGGLRFLTNGQLKRRELIESGALMALARFNW